MLHIAICEDTLADAERTRGLLTRYGQARPHLQMQFQHFQTGRMLLDALQRGAHFDLYLLDMLLPDTDGIDLARVLARTGKNHTVIYLTVSREYAVEAFSVRAANYLIKPVDQNTMFSALDEVVAHLGAQIDTCATVRALMGDMRVALSDIVFVEVTGHVFHYHMQSGETIQSKVLRIPFNEVLAELIADKRFLRPHQSYLVNAAHVLHFSPHELVLDDDSQVPISRLRMGEVRRAYMNFLNSGRGTDGIL